MTIDYDLILFEGSAAVMNESLSSVGSRGLAGRARSGFRLESALQETKQFIRINPACHSPFSLAASLESLLALLCSPS